MQSNATEHVGMSTKTWYKDVEKVLDDMGISHEFRLGRKHTKVMIAKGGKRGVMVISASPSDRRALQQVRTIAKRIVW